MQSGYLGVLLNTCFALGTRTARPIEPSDIRRTRRILKAWSYLCGVLVASFSVCCAGLKGSTLGWELRVRRCLAGNQHYNELFETLQSLQAQVSVSQDLSCSLLRTCARSWRRPMTHLAMADLTAGASLRA